MSSSPKKKKFSVRDVSPWFVKEFEEFRKEGRIL
jgi:hypothetical protein